MISFKGISDYQRGEGLLEEGMDEMKTEDGFFAVGRRSE
jgi:hypothetical protein